MVTITIRSALCGRLAGLAICLTAFGLAGCDEKQQQPPEKIQSQIFFKTNDQGRLVPATSTGELWPVCKPPQCNLPVEAPEIPNRDAFTLIQVQFKQPPPKGADQAEQKAQLGGLVSVAHANGGDGCTIRWVYIDNFGWVPYWDPEDPDCPP